MTRKAFTGTATDIGYQVFEQMCLPVVRQASHNMPADQLVQLYAGLIGAMYGALAADVGQGLARGIVDHMAATFRTQEFNDGPSH